MKSNLHNLITILGSPFIDSSAGDILLSDEEKRDLYKLAKINKVGLFYLQRLKDMGALSPLEDIYKADMKRYDETIKTAVDLSSRLNELSDDFAIFKFYKPYPHTPTDVDVLFFSSNKDCSKVVDQLLDNGYYQICECPSQYTLYDLRGGYDNMDRRTVGGAKGGKYYVDIYKDVSASYLVYFTKDTVANRIHHVDTPYGSIKTLSPNADLPIVLTHSIVPEQLFTLADYFTSLSFVKNMSKTELEDMVSIIRENNIILANSVAFYLASLLHQEIFGFVPDQLRYLINLLECNLERKINIDSDGFTMPYRHPPLILIKVLIERSKNKKGFSSMVRQGIHMVDPRLMMWVLYNIVLRRTRETY